MSFLMDDEIGTKDVQEFGECEKMFLERKKETMEIHGQILDKLSPVYKTRLEKEWAYCLLYDYKNSSMSIDFTNIIMSLANFYFDEEYVAKIDKTDNNSSMIPKKQVIISKAGTSIHKQQQEYIISTINILIGMNNAKVTGNSKQQNEGETFEIDYTYQIFLILCVLGKELNVQNTIIEIHEQNIKDMTDPYQKELSRKKLQNLILFCKKKSQSIINLPFNTHTSSSIIQNFILEAKLVYENMISVDDVQ